MREAGGDERGTLRKALDDVLINRAEWTYSRLTAGHRHRVDLHEETITQDLLLDISAAFTALQVTTFTKKQESLNGADWQWDLWFGGSVWFGLRIQAKRLRKIGSSQPGYGFDYKTKSGNRRQVDYLIDDARRAGMQAAYVLYNVHDLDLSSFVWGCGRLPPREAFFGVSLLPATAARSLADAGTLDLANVGTLSRPWSCLTSCDSVNCSQNMPSELYGHRGLGLESENLVGGVALSFLRLEFQASRALDQRSRPSAPILLEAPPSYVSNLLSQGFRSEAKLPRRVGALTVFHDNLFA